jgi:IS6 family transposase
MRRPRAAPPNADRSAFAGFRFPREVITVAVRWYLRYGVSYRDVEEMLAERGVEVDHVTVYRWVQRFTPLFAEAARPLRHASGDRWFVEVIDVMMAEQRDSAAARRFFTRAVRHGPAPVEVTTDKAAPYLRVLDELVPAGAHVTEQYGNNPIESDHARLKARLRPMRGLKRLRSAARIAAGHAFVQNLRSGHYELATEVPRRSAWPPHSPSSHRPCDRRFLHSRPPARSAWTQQTLGKSVAWSRAVVLPVDRPRQRSVRAAGPRDQAAPANRRRSANVKVPVVGASGGAGFQEGSR